MPLMAHKDNGFHQANSSEVDTMKAAGWELCDDPIEYKKRAWGIDYAPKESIATIETPLSDSGDEDAAGDDAPKRRGRPRKGQ